MTKINRWGLGLFCVFGTAALGLFGCQKHASSHEQGHTERHGDGHSDLHGRHTVDSHSPFKARHIRKQATITVNGTLETVWPLFDPLNEGKWAAAWQPEILHPTDGTVKEGMVVRTPDGHGKRGTNSSLIWMVTRYDTENHRITYTVSNPERIFTVDVQCSKHDESHTDASITYNFVGLTDLGNTTIERSAKHMDLMSWQKLINHYLKTGETLPPGNHGSHDKEGAKAHGHQSGLHGH